MECESFISLRKNCDALQRIPRNCNFNVLSISVNNLLLIAICRLMLFEQEDANLYAEPVILATMVVKYFKVKKTCKRSHLPNKCPLIFFLFL